ncbi:MAG: hypothetical protein KGH65_03825 [Candidatus Micrarchaeota archaeon]|nr:hypothetical protein [Candidatus Micrarchaeota archaeon]
MNSDGTVSDIHEDDVEDILDVSRKMRDGSPMMGSRYKSGLTHVAHIPPVIIEKIWNEHKVNFFKREDLPRFLSILRTDYAHLMTVPGNPFGVKKVPIVSRSLKATA